MHRKIITFCFALCVIFFANAQDKGKIKVVGYTIHTDSKGKKSPLPNMNLTVFRGTENIEELMSNKKGRYEIKLEYGYMYKVVFDKNEGYIDMSFAVDAKVPPQKQDLNPTIELDVPMFTTGTAEIDTLKFKFPFTKFKFDGNKKFIDDAKYLSEFERGLFKEYKEAQKQVKKQQAESIAQAKFEATARFVMVGGKLLAGDPPNTVVRNMKIHLLNDKGAVIETATTDKFGKFAFSKLTSDRNYTIRMDENDSLKLSGTKITMYNRKGKEVFVTTSGEKGGFKFQLLASDKANLMQLEIEDNSLLIAGTLEALLAGKTQPVSKVRVVLANAGTNVVYEIVETDVNGRFVFSKLPPDKNFVIRLEDTSTELANIKITFRDRNGNEVASGDADGFGKFRFEFLAGDGEVLNKLQVEESDIKMDLTGKFLIGDEKNVPLNNIKVDLLDDVGTVLQSTTTNDTGVFLFKELILYNGYFFRLDEADTRIASLSAVVLADKIAKPVKEYKLNPAQGIKYRLLVSDQRRLGRLYLK
ncbi:MAG: hypothetical protein HYU69_16085 [Bacteroidetes bacterium]|nr:hypothetical protein [Bacteroidota bacterium]